MIKNIVLNNKVHVKVFSNGSNNVKEVMIAIHGFTGSKDGRTITLMGENLVSDDLDLLSFDFPSHGESKTSRPLSLKECLEYLDIVDKYVKDTYKDAKISFFATSYGGYVLLNYLNNSDYPYNHVFLRAPAIMMHKVFKEVITKDAFVNENGDTMLLEDIVITNEFFKELDENKLMEKYDNKLFLHVFQGKKDEVLDYKDNEEFFINRCKDNHRLYYFEDSKHSFKTKEETDKLLYLLKQVLNG